MAFNTVQTRRLLARVSARSPAPFGAAAPRSLPHCNGFAKGTQGVQPGNVGVALSRLCLEKLILG